jgi:hypothetical protein
MDNGSKNEQSSGISFLPISIGLVVFVIWFMTIAPELPEVFNGHPMLKRSEVKGNMRTCQIAAETYAEKHSGHYPKSVADKEFRNYFPGGHPPDKPGFPLNNPVTGNQEWPVAGSVADVIAARQQIPNQSGNIGKGIVEYSAIFNSKREPISYAIRGGDMTGQAIAGSTGKVLVLSNK